jgi:acyl-CoA thioesterase
MHFFDADTQCDDLGGGQFKTTVTDRWSINGNPNGGYLMALLCSAMQKGSEKKLPAILTANFLTRTQKTGSHVAVENISQSRTFNRMQARLIQNGQECVRAWGTFTDENVCQGDSRYERAEPGMADLNACIPIPEFGRYSLYGQIDARLDPACTGWFQGDLSDISEHKGWISFKDKRPFDALSLILMSDSFPPPVMASQGMVAWVPTVEFSINIRAIPTGRWLKTIFRSRYITCGLVEEDGELWDEGGRLVAICRQIAQFRKNP